MISVFVESWNGQFKKVSFEAVAYAKAWATQSGVGVRAFTSKDTDAAQLGAYGADEVHTLELHSTPTGIAQQLSAANEGSTGWVIAGTATGKVVAPQLTAFIQGALSTNTQSLPLSVAPLTVKRGAFSSKGIETDRMTHV